MTDHLNQYRALGELISFNPMILSDSAGDTAEILYLPLGGFCVLVGGFQFLPAGPNLLHLMDLCIQEVGLLGHFSEN